MKEVLFIEAVRIGLEESAGGGVFFYQIDWAITRSLTSMIYSYEIPEIEQHL